MKYTKPHTISNVRTLLEDLDEAFSREVGGDEFGGRRPGDFFCFRWLIIMVCRSVRGTSNDTVFDVREAFF